MPTLSCHNTRSRAACDAPPPSPNFAYPTPVFLLSCACNRSTAICVPFRSKKDENSEDAGAQARKALGQLLGQALNLLDPQAAADVAAAATSNAEGPAPTSDSETIVANVAKEAGGQQWATADAANSNESPRTRSNSPPTAQLVRVATLVSGK